jgi:hypothetical protein
MAWGLTPQRGVTSAARVAKSPPVVEWRALLAALRSKFKCPEEKASHTTVWTGCLKSPRWRVNTSAASDVRPHRGDCHHSKYGTHWVTLNCCSKWIFLYSLCTHTHTRKLNKLWTNFACSKCLHSPQVCHLFLMSHLQFIRPTAVWTCHFSTKQHSTVTMYIFSCTNLYGITSLLCNRNGLEYYNTWNWHVKYL